MSSSFLERVRRSYRMAIVARRDAGEIWGPITQRRADVHAALLADTDDDLRRIFADPMATDLYLGVSERYTEQLSDKATHVDLLRDDLGVLARVIGSVGPINWNDVDAALGQYVEFPEPFRGEIGMQTPRGVATFRGIQALYQTWRILALLRSAKDRSITEIGPGMGRTALYAFRAGITDYTTIDLPLGMVGQACFFGATLGEDRIWLEGDDDREANGRIRILCGTRPDRIFDLAFNADSLTEMPLGIARDYAEWIRAHARGFLSINRRQTTFTVADVAALQFPTARVEQKRYPMRKGYTEEMYFFVGSEQSPSSATSHMWLNLKVLARRLARGFARSVLPLWFRNILREYM